MDHDEEKERVVKRHLKGGQRFEERKANLAKRKARGHGPREHRGYGDHGFDDDVDGAFDVENGIDAPRRSRRGRPDRTAGSSPAADDTGTSPGRVVSVARTEVTVWLDEGETLAAKVVPRVRAQGSLVVGDRVRVDRQGRVTDRLPRETQLERADPGNPRRSLLLAANVDVGLIVLAPRSNGLSLGLIDRAVAALQDAGIEPAVVLTKLDQLPAGVSPGEAMGPLQPWQTAGIRVFGVSSVLGDGLAELRQALEGRVTVLIGHSGVGKSTLVNALHPGVELDTGDVRASDGKGRHTTTASRLVPFLGDGALVDIPGVRMFAPRVTDPAELAAAIPEVAPWLGLCRFSDCSHHGELGCAVEQAAVDDPAVAAGLKRLRRLIQSAG